MSQSESPQFPPWDERTSRVVAPGWELVSDETEFAERVCRWHHPAGASLVSRVGVDPGLTLRVVLKADGPGPVRVPGPRWCFDVDEPVQVWPAGSRGCVVARVGSELLVWTEQAGRAGLADGGVSLWGPTVQVSPDHPLLASWRGEVVPDVARVRAMLPGWLPASLVVEMGSVIDLCDPDSAILLDGDEMASEQVTVPLGMHRLEMRRASGDVLLDVGSAPSLAARVTARAHELLTSADPRRASGGAAWLLTWASLQGLVDHDGLLLAREIVENVLARRDDHSGTASLRGDHVLAICAGCQASWSLADDELWDTAERACQHLDRGSPGALMSQALMASVRAATGRPGPDDAMDTAASVSCPGRDPAHLAEPISDRPRRSGAGDAENCDPRIPRDPSTDHVDSPDWAAVLAAAERDLWLTPPATVGPRANHAAWLLGEVVPAVNPGPLMARDGQVPLEVTAWALAVTSVWPGLHQPFGEPIGVMRDRARRRLLAVEHLDDAVLALLTW